MPGYLVTVYSLRVLRGGQNSNHGERQTRQRRRVFRQSLSDSGHEPSLGPYCFSLPECGFRMDSLVVAAQGTGSSYTVCVGIGDQDPVLFLEAFDRELFAWDTGRHLGFVRGQGSVHPNDVHSNKVENSP